MTGPRNPIELSYEDLLGGVIKAAAPVVEGEQAAVLEAETGGDFLNTINSMMERADAFITNVKDLISMVKGTGLIGGPAAQLPAQPYQPQPTLVQQLHQVVNVCYTAYGDITLTELIQGLLAQYGGVKLSVVLKALEGQK